MLGAIDPARVSFQPVTTTNANGKGPDHDLMHIFLHPQSLSIWKFGMILLEQQLVPELRRDIDNVYAQDRTCFAIQTVLRVLANTLPDFTAITTHNSGISENGDKITIAALPSASSSSTIATSSMPSKLRAELINNQLLG
jgi:hypothetical protein